jgi:hypothetical protein
MGHLREVEELEEEEECWCCWRFNDHPVLKERAWHMQRALLTRNRLQSAIAWRHRGESCALLAKLRAALHSFINVKGHWKVSHNVHGQLLHPVLEERAWHVKRALLARNRF